MARLVPGIGGGGYGGYGGYLPGPIPDLDRRRPPGWLERILREVESLDEIESPSEQGGSSGRSVGLGGRESILPGPTPDLGRRRPVPRWMGGGGLAPDENPPFYDPMYRDRGVGLKESPGGFLPGPIPQVGRRRPFPSWGPPGYPPRIRNPWPTERQMPRRAPR